MTGWKYALNNLPVQLDFISRYLLVFWFLLVFAKGILPIAYHKIFNFSPVLLLVSPLNNLINAHTVPKAPDV